MPCLVGIERWAVGCFSATQDFFTLNSTWLKQIIGYAEQKPETKLQTPNPQGEDPFLCLIIGGGMFVWDFGTLDFVHGAIPPILLAQKKS